MDDVWAELIRNVLPRLAGTELTKMLEQFCKECFDQIKAQAAQAAEADGNEVVEMAMVLDGVAKQLKLLKQHFASAFAPLPGVDLVLLFANWFDILTTP